MREQASELLNAPAPETLGGLCDRSILALLIGCGLRRAEDPRASRSIRFSSARGAG